VPQFNRRQFLATAASAPALSAIPPGSPASPIDFRYAPLSGQTAFCFPDDHHKSLVGERGELRYADSTVEFTLRGMESDRITEQRLDEPAVPIVHTRIERPEAWLDLTTFATNRAGEGRVDNVLIEIRSRTAKRIFAVPQISVRTKRDVTTKGPALYIDAGAAPFLVADAALGGRGTCNLPECSATAELPARYFVRLPQEGQSVESESAAADSLLAEAREYWRERKVFAGDVDWALPGRYGEFLTACARNILQAREVKDGRLTFQVGPTVYRGLWVVDGHFILESARYLGYDAEAQQGLETTWARQEPNGGIFAAAGREHYKDTGIAMFTLVRQAELAGDFGYFRKMQPEILHAAAYLRGLRDKARDEESANGRYGLLPRGMGDGGLGGIRSEFTNTLWALAGLKSVADTAARLGIAGFEPVKQLHDELRAASLDAIGQEMRRHPAGFPYLPMLMKEDPQWDAANERARPTPQVGQWALSHCIYPGLLFDRNDPMVRGHIALMQACTLEDIPAETGWIARDGVWNYNAAFVAHVYLWAGLNDWARRTFHGFLNHATSLYCWREEQPLRGSMTAGYVGDMPHNWASAECVLYLRHMLALEDGDTLRLLAGIGDFELSAGQPLAVKNSPTRFGRVTVELEPDGRRRRLRFERPAGPAPKNVELPQALAGLRLGDVKGAAVKRDGERATVDPDARSWTAVYGS
jgi:hypothetical protein